MNTRTLKIITGILTAVTTLTLINVGDGRNGPENEVHLQCSSLVYASSSNRYAGANANVRRRKHEDQT